MKVAYPRKFNAMNARDILKQVVEEREIHPIALNRYRYNSALRSSLQIICIITIINFTKIYIN